MTGPIHERIKTLRESRGIRQFEFAARVEVDRATVWHWENRFSRPTIAQLTLIADVLGVTVSELIRGEDKVAA